MGGGPASVEKPGTRECKCPGADGEQGSTSLGRLPQGGGHPHVQWCVEVRPRGDGYQVRLRCPVEAVRDLDGKARRGGNESGPWTADGEVVRRQAVVGPIEAEDLAKDAELEAGNPGADDRGNGIHRQLSLSSRPSPSHPAPAVPVRGGSRGVASADHPAQHVGRIFRYLGIPAGIA